MRLQKFLARAGVASRRGSEDLMTAGRVAVNGEIVTALGAKVDPKTDVVAVDGKVVHLDDGPRYIALNKPAGYVTTMDDPQGRPTVRELVPSDVPGLFPVGRLDLDTTGVLLFSTDGELAHKLLHPKYHVAKTYLVHLEGRPGRGDLDRLRSGIQLEDGPTKPAEVRVIKTGKGEPVVEITISEGRKRQVKRMFSAICHPVVRLHRVSFGPVSLEGLPEGQWRDLSAEEVAALRGTASERGE